MRANRLLAAVSLCLAGCGPAEKVAGRAANGASAASASSAPAAAPAPVAEPRTEDSIPAAFHGVYDSSSEACGRPGDGRLTVSAGELRFHESIGTIRSVEPSPSGAIRVEADYQGEGESWRSARDLRLSEDGAKLTISGDGTSFDRIRCSKEGR